MTTFVFPKNQETAQALLAAAEVVGKPAWVVETTFDGFAVPDDVADAFHRALTAQTKPRRTRRTSEKE